MWLYHTSPCANLNHILRTWVFLYFLRYQIDHNYFPVKSRSMRKKRFSASYQIIKVKTDTTKWYYFIFSLSCFSSIIPVPHYYHLVSKRKSTAWWHALYSGTLLLSWTILRHILLSQEIDTLMLFASLRLISDMG